MTDCPLVFDPSSCPVAVKLQETIGALYALLERLKTLEEQVDSLFTEEDYYDTDRGAAAK